jgi:thioredoxin reductase (NADPH)
MFQPVIIIGGGPAGISAAIQLKRSGLVPLVLEPDRMGGLLLNANLVENYPGFAGGITGQCLVNRFQRHLKQLNIMVVKKQVKGIKKIKGGFKIITDHDSIDTQAVIIASGTQPRRAGFKGELELSRKRRLCYEVRNMPVLSRQDVITIIGGGDAAFDYALNLARRARAINIMYRKRQPKCLPLLLKRVRGQFRIKLFPQTRILAVERVRLKDRNCLIVTIKKGNKVKLINSDRLLVAVGREPAVGYLPWSVQQAERIPGIFVAGDVKRGALRQTVIAAGDGLLAAMQAVEYLRGKA